MGRNWCECPLLQGFNCNASLALKTLDRPNSRRRKTSNIPINTPDLTSSTVPRSPLNSASASHAPQMLHFSNTFPLSSSMISGHDTTLQNTSSAGGAIIGGFVCSVCDKAFTYLSLLQRHMTKHTGERPFPCPHCPHRSKQRANLQRHLLTHFPATFHLARDGLPNTAEGTQAQNISQCPNPPSEESSLHDL